MVYVSLDVSGLCKEFMKNAAMCPDHLASNRDHGSYCECCVYTKQGLGDLWVLIGDGRCI